MAIGLGLGLGSGPELGLRLLGLGSGRGTRLALGEGGRDRLELARVLDHQRVHNVRGAHLVGYRGRMMGNILIQIQ